MTVSAITAPIVLNVQITALGKWTSHALYVRIANIMKAREWICGGASVTGIKLQIGMQREKDRALKL